MLLLGLLNRGEKAEIVSIREHGCSLKKSGLDCRTEDIGLRPGKIVEVLCNELRGPMLLKIDESRVAIGRGVAMKIMVKQKP
ncbi:MAG: FeoA family protein [Dissulfurispiraceae bacterium]|nr:FeoA family protein [Dissulfurispiraceae bacterium]